MYKNLFDYLHKEPSRFSHNNIDLLNDFSLANEANSTDYIIGPQVYDQNALSIGIHRLIYTSLVSFLTFGIAFTIETFDEKFTKFSETATKFILENKDFA